MIKSKQNRFCRLRSLKLLLAVSILVLLFGSLATKSSAQSNSDVVYDYVILMDTSGSMNDGTPPLFGQVQKVAQDFVNVLQDRSNVAVYSFDTTYSLVGTWNNVNSSDKSTIINQISSMQASGQSTALWDAVCEGLSQLEEMGKSGGQHIQLLISYTDGKDNASQNQSSTCLARYKEMQKDGYTYWIYNAIGGVNVPDEVTNLKDIIGIVDSANPMPIRVVHVQPLTLNIGNLYSSGKSNPNTSCLVFWASDPTIYGNEIQFAKPPTADRALPNGSASQICAEGTNCDRTIKISTSSPCLQFTLINYNQKNISSSDMGEYTLTLPLDIPYSQPQDRVFVIPNSIKLNFRLEYPPTITPNPTATVTPLPTNTPLPTSTITPIPPATVINCGGKSAFDAGLIQLSRSQPITTREFTCHLDWNKYFLPQSLVVDLQYDEKKEDNKNLSNFIWLSKDGELAKTISLIESDSAFDVIINIPQDEWKIIGNGTQTFSGDIRLTPANTSLIGDIDPQKLTLPVSFQIKKPISLLTISLVVGGLLVILLAVLFRRIKSIQTPPRFNAVLSYENNGNEIRVNLMNVRPIKIDRNHSKIVVGQDQTCEVKLPQNPSLGGQYFSLVAEKSQGKTNISIIPVESLKVNDLPVATKRVLKSKDTIKVDELEFHIFISNS